MTVRHSQPGPHRPTFAATAKVNISINHTHKHRQSLVGTSYYMAPEMLTGAGVHDHSNDAAVVVLALSCSESPTHPQGIQCPATYGRWASFCSCFYLANRHSTAPPTRSELCYSVAFAFLWQHVVHACSCPRKLSEMQPSLNLSSGVHIWLVLSFLPWHPVMFKRMSILFVVYSRRHLTRHLYSHAPT